MDKWLEREPGYRFRFQRSDGEFRVKAIDDENVMDIPVEWAFGAGDQAVTFVTRINADWYLEHYFSYYSALRGMAPTAGHSVLRPKNLPEAMGLPYKATDPNTGILGCFECHSTGPVTTGPEGKLQPAEMGVRCEACHGPALDHVEAARNRRDPARLRTLVRNPGKLSAAEILQFCGRCHRPPAEPGVKIDWNYAWNVRHQPVYLSESKCFTKSNGRLSCLTCHDPHQPSRNTTASFYRDRCTSCHDKARGGLAPAKTCVQQTDKSCADCHMPKVSPQPPLQFTNHWIGVYGSQLLRPR